jgi:hypothetical protein
MKYYYELQWSSIENSIVGIHIRYKRILIKQFDNPILRTQLNT